MKRIHILNVHTLTSIAAVIQGATRRQLLEIHFFLRNFQETQAPPLICGVKGGEKMFKKIHAG
jgi:hypothetical protein